MQLSFHEPVGALGIFLAFGVAASVIASAATGPILSRMGVGSLTALGITLVALALTVEGAAPVFSGAHLRAVVVQPRLWGLGLCPQCPRRHPFRARDINWMHASFGLGATIALCW